MPTRDIKESCRTSRTLAKISAGAERLFWRLTTYADDFGRFPADADVVRASCFSVMLDTVRENHVTNWLMELSTVDLIRFYESEDHKTYGFFPTWTKHQRTRAKHSKYPAPTSADICRQMPADVAVVTEDTEVVPKKNEDTVSSDCSSAAFAAFWAAYPKHENRKKAEEAWKRLNPSAELQTRILAAIAEQREGASWRDGFIPAPFRWLRDRRWQDEVTKSASNGLLFSPKTAGNVEALRRAGERLMGSQP